MLGQIAAVITATNSASPERSGPVTAGAAATGLTAGAAAFGAGAGAAFLLAFFPCMDILKA